MNTNKIYQKLETKVLNIQIFASVYDEMMFSDVGKELWSRFEASYIGNTHLIIKNALLSIICLEIIKLFDENKKNLSLHHLLKAIKDDYPDEYRSFLEEYNYLKGNHHLDKITKFRHKWVARNAAEKVKITFSMDDLNFVINAIRTLFEKIFTLLNPNKGITKNIHDQVSRFANSYFKRLLEGVRKKQEIFN